MPSLADIYSAINTAQRRGGDFIRNPGTSLQQMLGNANDRARALNEQDRAATDEFLASGQLNGPKQMQSAMDMAASYNPVGMTVWHGSPHIFEKFDVSKIGSGEGGKAYGKGLYMAENPNVAKSYQSVHANKSGNPIDYANHIVGAYSGDEAKALTSLKTILPEPGQTAFGGESREMIQGAINAIENQSYKNKSVGNLYKVDLPDTHIRRMLAWDEPLKNQPKKVREFAKSLGMDLNDLGGDLVAKVGKTEEGKQILQNAGIPGIKYIDPSSKVKSSNFVVFDPNHLTILERNNQAIK